MRIRISKSGYLWILNTILKCKLEGKISWKHLLYEFQSFFFFKRQFSLLQKDYILDLLIKFNLASSTTHKELWLYNSWEAHNFSVWNSPQKCQIPCSTFYEKMCANSNRICYLQLQLLYPHNIIDNFRKVLAWQRSRSITRNTMASSSKVCLIV